MNLCKFFRKLPSEILDEDVEVIQLMKIYQLANPEKDGDDG
jgi:hypothetical protein